jgi:pyruvate formate lyase activating enzyme
VDSPGDCSILFFPGCNERCPYCYNVDIVKGIDEDDSVSVDEATDFIRSRILTGPNGKFNTVDWIVFSGGECTLHKDDLYKLMKVSSDIGLKNCLYTNGTSKKLSEAVDFDLVSAVNIDYKWPISDIGRFGFSKFTTWTENFRYLLKIFSEGKINYLRANTTIMRSYHNKDVLFSMLRVLQKILDTDYDGTLNIDVRNGWKTTLMWSIQPFFNDNGKMKTLEDISPSEQPSKAYVSQMIIDLREEYDKIVNF